MSGQMLVFDVLQVRRVSDLCRHLQSSKQCPAAPSKQSSAKSEGRSEVQGDGAMHSDNSFQKRDRPPPKSTGQHSFQSGTVASRSKSVSQKRRSLSVESSRSVQSARGSRPSTGGRAQTSSRPHTSRGASLTRANRGSGFGSVQGTCSYRRYLCILPCSFYSS